MKKAKNNIAKDNAPTFETITFENLDYKGREFYVESINDIKQAWKGNPIVWSWGVEAVIRASRSTMVLKVNGIAHKGIVIVHLNGADLFDIYCVKALKIVADEKLKVDRKVEYVVASKSKDVFISELTQSIDALVEKGSMTGKEYRKAVAKAYS